MRVFEEQCIATDENNVDNIAILEMVKGKWKGLKFSFGQISFDTESVDGQCNCSYVLHVHNEETIQEFDLDEFKDFSSQILVEMLEDYVEKVKNDEGQ